MVGANLSAMMNECITADQKANIYAHAQGGPYRIFFHKLCRLLRSPVIVVFVFDGPGHPNFKRGKKINTTKAPYWTASCKELITAFGFYWHEVCKFS